MTRYIAIEHNSGYIWGDATTETPEAACTAITTAADFSRPWDTWERVPPIRDTDGGYHLYVAPEGFPEVEDGQDQEMIERVVSESGTLATIGTLARRTEPWRSNH